MPLYFRPQPVVPHSEWGNIAKADCTLGTEEANYDIEHERAALIGILRGCGFHKSEEHKKAHSNAKESTHFPGYPSVIKQGCKEKCLVDGCETIHKIRPDQLGEGVTVEEIPIQNKKFVEKQLHALEDS